MLAALAWVGQAAAQHAPGPTYVGAEACRACHAEQSAAQILSGHAGSLAKPLEHRLAAQFKAVPQGAADGQTGSLQIDGEALRLGPAPEGGGPSPAVDWAFGAGEQAVTFVSRVDEDWYLEHRWSYYAATGGLGLTPGHQPNADPRYEEAGVRYRIFSPRAEILRCFACHSTGPLEFGEGYAVVPSEPGVRCESCHGPGSVHMEAVAAGDLARAVASIRQPGRLAARDLNSQCGACHRPPQSDPAEIDWDDPWNVRHQPVYLSRSACFTADVGLRCTTCHDPHAKLVRSNLEHYNTRCTACHSEVERPPADACPPSGTMACASCHMPRTRPQPELSFTNHWIGIYAEGSPLRPLR